MYLPHHLPPPPPLILTHLAVVGWLVANKRRDRDQKKAGGHVLPS